MNAQEATALAKMREAKQVLDGEPVQALKRGEPVEVYALAFFPDSWRWFDGYVFDALEVGTGCALVRHVGGTYDGCLVRYDTSRVRRVKP